MITASCCNYNNLGQAELIFGGTDSKTFLPETVNSIAWLVESGSVEITIDGGTPVEYTSSGVIGFDGLNANTILFEVVSGTTLIQWTY